MDKKTLLGVGITNARKEEVLEYIIQGCEKSGKRQYVVTPNPEILVLANRRKSLKAVLKNADLALCDGVGVFLALKLMRKGVKERISGADFVKNLCERINGKPITVGFLGSKPGVAEEASECLLFEYPGLDVVYARHEWNPGFIKKGEENSPKNIDILFVAFGAPRQEEWIAQHLEELPVKFAMAVGGTFDYLSGKTPRAPRIVRAIGLEWLFRLVTQPWRIKRQLALPVFVYLVIKELLFTPKSSQ